MPAGVYGENVPTLVEFFGPIAGTTALILAILVAISGIAWMPWRKAGWFDALIGCWAGLWMSSVFLSQTAWELGGARFRIGFTLFIWLVIFAGIGRGWYRLKHQHGMNAVINSVMGVICGFVLVVILIPTFSHAGEPARRTQCKNQLSQIGLALHNYHDQFASFPVQQHGEPPQSWRVRLLPFVDHADLFNRYHRHSAWDSPENSGASRTKIHEYLCLSQRRTHDDQGRYFTSYTAVYGPHNFWRDDRQARSLNDIPDGISNTIAVVEACGQNIIWNEPRDLPAGQVDYSVNAQGPTRHDSPSVLSSLHKDGAHVLLADGRVRFFSRQTDPAVLRALFSADQGDDPTDW